MGVFDSFRVNCECGKVDNPQTKLFGNELKNYDVGDELHLGEYSDFILKTKTDCYHCKKPVFIWVVNYVIVKISNSSGTLVQEGVFGSVSYDDIWVNEIDEKVE